MLLPTSWMSLEAIFMSACLFVCSVLENLSVALILVTGCLILLFQKCFAALSSGKGNENTPRKYLRIILLHMHHTWARYWKCCMWWNVQLEEQWGRILVMQSFPNYLTYKREAWIKRLCCPELDEEGKRKEVHCSHTLESLRIIYVAPNTLGVSKYRIGFNWILLCHLRCRTTGHGWDGARSSVWMGWHQQIGMDRLAPLGQCWWIDAAGSLMIVRCQWHARLSECVASGPPPPACGDNSPPWNNKGGKR